MDLSEAFTQIDSMELSSPNKIIPSEMTDEELSHLRFTTFKKKMKRISWLNLRKEV